MDAENREDGSELNAQCIAASLIIEKWSQRYPATPAGPGTLPGSSHDFSVAWYEPNEEATIQKAQARGPDVIHSSFYERHTYSGFEPAQAFDVVYGGHFEHRLLSPRRATMDHQRLTIGNVRIETGQYDFPVIAQGAMPKDCVCIGMVAEGWGITRYNTQAIDEGEIQVYGPGVELLYHAGGASRWINFTVAQADLQSVAAERLGRPLDLPVRGLASIRIAAQRRVYLRTLVDDAMALARSLQPEGIGTRLAHEMARSLVTAYADSLCAADLDKRSSRTQAADRHYHLILACERLMQTQLMTEVDLTEIARRSGYSLRSIEHIFKQRVGMTPGRWFANMRLNGALRDLIAPVAGCSVTDVATRWGFRHLSRFASQYRGTFGELPSQTLARAQARM
ncbi:MAG: AraC family transcriptional regulator [Proteobacteria bacterium]|nr:AraC family transcriptional regulator [Pseudomonadota bacterium]